MSSDSTSDGAGEFDFGAWCPVCERQIPSAVIDEASPQQPPSSSASTAANADKKKKHQKTVHVAGPHGVRRRPSGKKKQNSHSSASLHALTSTLPTPPLTDQDALEPPSELYCSDECRRIDEMRSRLALSHLGDPSNSSVFRPPAMARSLSGASSKDGGNTWDALHFTTRRPSRGIMGGYSYRPSLMARVPSHETSTHRPVSNASSDSLASLGMAEADERSERGYGGTRPPSALSSFRLMTPIQSPLASPALQAAQPGSRGRQRVSMPRAQSDNSGVNHDHQAHRYRRSASSHGKNAAALASPPLASPEVMTGPSSVPSNLMMEMLPPPMLIKSESPRVDLPRRNGSSASLALMGTSLSRSYGSKTGWAAPQRTASTLSLSGLVAQAIIVPQSEPTSTAPAPVVGKSTANGSSASARMSASPSSVSSVSTAHSHWSASQRSTATSNDYADQPPLFTRRSSSFSGNHDETADALPNRTKRRISSRGLTMTPSSSSLHTMEVMSEALSENTPTRSLSKVNSLSAMPRHDSDSAGSGTVRRQSRGTGKRPSNVSIDSANRVVERPSLSPNPIARLKSTEGVAASDASMNAPIGPGRKNWSWDQMGVATYAALDLDQVRKSAPAQSAGDDAGVSAAPRTTTNATKERKRLFYFDDAVPAAPTFE